MKANIESLLLSDVKGGSASGWRQDGLFNFCYSLLFRYHTTFSFPFVQWKSVPMHSEWKSSCFPRRPRAGYLTLFDSTDNVTAIYKEFRKFDKLLSKLVRGSLKKSKLVCNFSFHSACPVSDTVSATGETHTVNSSRKRLWELLSADWLSRASGPISWQQSYNRFLEEEGVDMEMQRRASLLQLWTTQVSAAHRQMEWAPQTGEWSRHTHPAWLNSLLSQLTMCRRSHSAQTFHV